MRASLSMSVASSAGASLFCYTHVRSVARCSRPRCLSPKRPFRAYTRESKPCCIFAGRFCSTSSVAPRSDDAKKAPRELFFHTFEPPTRSKCVQKVLQGLRPLYVPSLTIIFGIWPCSSCCWFAPSERDLSCDDWQYVTITSSPTWWSMGEIREPLLSSCIVPVATPDSGGAGIELEIPKAAMKLQVHYEFGVEQPPLVVILRGLPEVHSNGECDLRKDCLVNLSKR